MQTVWGPLVELLGTLDTEGANQVFCVLRNVIDYLQGRLHQRSEEEVLTAREKMT